MLTYRQISEEKEYAREIWNIERTAPRIFREASDVWTPTFEDFRLFFDRCEVWGLFNDDDTDIRLLAVVYLEYLTERKDTVNIHVSVLVRIATPQITRFFASLTRHKTDEGVISKSAWILERNRFLLDIAKQSGYVRNGLRMDYGAARGKLLRWVQVDNLTLENHT